MKPTASLSETGDASSGGDGVARNIPAAFIPYPLGRSKGAGASVSLPLAGPCHIRRDAFHNIVEAAPLMFFKVHKCKFNSQPSYTQFVKQTPEAL